MAAVLAGEAAVRIVPTLRNFHSEVRRGLKAQPHSLEVEVKPQLAKADAELAAWRARQSSNAVNVPIRADFQSFQRDLSQVEHIFKRSSVAKAIRVNIAVAGVDALPALAYAAGSAAAAVDALGKAAFALPGLLGGALASAGALATGLHGVSDALKAYAQDSDKATENARKHQDADRELTSAKRNLQNAIRDQKREMEDLNHEMRRSSLSEADAILSIQEDFERLKKGGFKSITELQRAQLQLLQDTDHLTEVRTKNNRTIEDANKANAEGVLQSDKVSDALDRVAKATESIDHSNVSKVNEALAKLSPNAQATVEAIHELQGEWNKLVYNPTAEALLSGMDKSLNDLASRTLPLLGSGLATVATGLNTNLKAISSSLGADKNSSLLTRIFGNTQGGLTNASKGMDSLINGILQLTSTSSNFLPRLGDAATKVFAKFDGFIDRISNDGSMTRWIDKGLKAVDSLGRSLGNAVSIISSIGQAFDNASGHTGGFLTNLDHTVKKWADFLKSTEGQNSLVGYFKQAKEFISGIGDAFKAAKPFLKDLVTAARDWSSTLLPIVASLAQMASWIERNTGLLKPLVEAYLAFRTVRPIVEGLTGAWKNYSTIMNAVGNQGGVGGVVQNGFTELKNKMYALGQTAETTAPKVNAGKNALEKYQISVGGATAKSIAGKDALAAYQGAVAGTGNTAATAAGKVDGKGGSLGGALKNLGKFIGPGLAFTAAIVGVSALIEKLGEAHRNAAADADRQKRALDGLKESVDSVSGAAGKAALAQTAKSNQKFAVPGLGDRNVNEDIARIGLGDAGTLLDAQNPINQGKRDELTGKLFAATKAKVAASGQWRKFHGVWESNGIDLDTISRAMNSDQEALNKVRDAEKRMFHGGTRQDAQQWGGLLEKQEIATGQAAPDLTSLTKDSGAYESVSVSAALQGGSRSLQEGGQLAREANDAVNKKGKFKGDGGALFGRAGSDDSKVSIGPDGNAVILSDRNPGVPSEIGTTIQNSAGQWQTTLTSDGTNRYIQKYAKGGLVKGVGGPTDDMNLAAMSAGEHVTRAKAVDYYGVGFFNALNNMQIPKHAGGGWGGIPLDPMGPPLPAPPPPAPTGGAGLHDNLPKRWGGVSGAGTGTFGGGAQHVGDGIARPTTGFGQLAEWGAKGASIVGSGLGDWVSHGGSGASVTGTPNTPGPYTGPNPLAPITSVTDAVGGGLSRAAGGIGRGLNDWIQHGGSGASLVADPPGPTFGWRAGEKTANPPYAPGAPVSKTPGAGQRYLSALGYFDPANAGKPWYQGPSAAPSSAARPQSGNYDYRDLIGARWVPSQGWVKPDGSPVLEGGSGPAPAAPGPTGFHPDPKTYDAAHPWKADGTGGFVPGGAPSLPGPRIVPHSQAPAPVGTPSYPVGNTPIYSVSPGAGGMPQIVPTGPVMGQMRGVIDQMIGTPYISGGNSLAGTDCSGLASIVSNIASGRPAFSGRFATPTEGRELTARGFLPGKGGPGMLTIGWNDSHTAITLPDGTAVSSGENGGVQYGGGGSEQGQFSQWMHLPVDSGALDGLLGGGTGLPGLDGLGIPGLGAAGAGTPAFLQPQNIMNFLAGQASSVGSGISQIGLGLFQGATGLNLSPLLSAGQELGNGAISALGGLGGSAGGGTEFNALAGADMSQFLTGGLPIGSGGGKANFSPGGGAEQWRPVVRQVLQQFGPKYGITNVKAWEDALVKQIGSESHGDPNSKNDHDSNGHGGTQSVAGLLNFLPSTFSANNITGGSFMDPQAQIAAAIPYVVKKYGMNPDGSPKWIGQGHGFKSGGFPPGSAMVSSGEFITNNKATSFYGPALFNALNSMSIPKRAIGGFKNGGFPRGIPRFEDGGYPVPPVDFGQPAPAPVTPQPPQTPGPLQLGQPSMEAPASTGGPPGPGATAPAPDPGGLPQVADALAGLGGGAPGQSDLPQPGAQDGENADDARATLGARPASMEHTAPAISQGISGAASTIGSIASMAASMAINGVAPGAGSAAGAGIQAGAQMAGSIATGAVNILSSLLVGTATPGSTAQASGIPLLPKRQGMQTGVPAVNQRVHNGDINVVNLDQFKRQQELMDAQNMMPRIGQYG